MDILLQDYLIELRSRGIRPGLERQQAALAKLQHPEKFCRSILIGGTNGKGSVAWYLDALLRSEGLTTARYISPPLIDFTERLCFNGSQLLPVDWEEAHGEVWSGLGGDPGLTEFEYSTLLALVMIAKRGVDCAVLEVGLGGRLDAVNVVVPEVSVITSIACEHQEFLGLTLAEIAFEKAGIIHPGIPVVVGMLPPDALRVVVAQAAMQEAKLYHLCRDFHPLPLRLRNRAPVQVNNAALAVRSAELLLGREYSAGDVQPALGELIVPGRGEEIERDGKRYYLDTAHNPAAAASLQLALEDYAAPAALFCGMVTGKDADGFFRALAPMVNSCTAADLASPRGRPAAELAAVAQRYWPSAVATAGPLASAFTEWDEQLPGGVLRVIAGSHYLVGPLRKLLINADRA